MLKSLKYIGIIIISILISVLASYYLISNHSKKQAYVDTIKVFNEFKMKKSLEVKMDKILQSDRLALDSLKLLQQRIYNDTIAGGDQRFVEIRSLQSKIEEKAYQASQNEISLTDKYNAQIWKQLNQYLKDFGKSKDLTFMYGTSGQGNILYATEENDLTEECIIYINNKYLGVE